MTAARLASLLHRHYPKSNFWVDFAYTGIDLGHKKSILVKNFQFSVEGIDEWVNVSAIKREAHSIKYVPFEEICLKLRNGMKLIVIFTLSSSFRVSREAQMKQKAYFRLVSDQERTVNDFISVAYRITTFLCFAIDQAVCIEDVSVYIEDASALINQEIDASSISIFYRSLPYTKETPSINLYEMLFSFSKIKNTAESIINNWIDAYENIEPALNLYFSTRVGEHRYLNSKFLALAQGLETYHRRTSSDKLMNEEKFQEVVQSLIEKCPDENKKWLEARLKHGNEVSLIPIS